MKHFKVYMTVEVAEMAESKRPRRDGRIVLIPRGGIKEADVKRWIKSRISACEFGKITDFEVIEQ